MSNYFQNITEIANQNIQPNTIYIDRKQNHNISVSDSNIGLRSSDNIDNLHLYLYDLNGNDINTGIKFKHVVDLPDPALNKDSIDFIVEGLNVLSIDRELVNSTLVPPPPNNNDNVLVSELVEGAEIGNPRWVLKNTLNPTTVSLDAGSSNNPSLGRIGETNTGLYFENPGEIDISILGNKRLSVSNTGTTVTNIICDKITYNNKGTVTDPALKFAANMGIYQVAANNAINFTDGAGASSISILQDGSKNVQFNNITCSTITGACTIGTITTPKLILTQTVSNSDPQIQSSTDLAPKTGINISENNLSIVTEGNIAATFANGQINFYKPCIIQYEANAIASRTGTITAINTDNKVQKLNFTSSDCIYILPTGLNDGARYELIPFKTAGAFACYIQVGTGATISTIIGGVKTNYSTAGTNIALTEGYAYNCIYQSSITTWIVWRSS